MHRARLPGEGIDPRVDFLTEPAGLALGDAGAVPGRHEVVHRPYRHAIDTSVLNDGGQNLRLRAPWFKKRRKAGAGAQAQRAQLGTAGPDLPVAIAMAVTARASRSRFFSPSSAPVLVPTSGSIRRSAAKPIISCKPDQHLCSSPPACGSPSWGGHQACPLGSGWLSHPTLPRNPMVTTIRDVTGKHRRTPVVTGFDRAPDHAPVQPDQQRSTPPQRFAAGLPVVAW